MKLNVLVTGGAGFIGSHITDRLLREGNYRVIIVDDLSTGSENNLPLSSPDVELITANVTDMNAMERIFRDNEISYVFHEAAIASVQESVERPLQTHRVNCEATLGLLELCRNHCPSLKRFVFAGSAAVFGDTPQLPKTEDSPVKPMSPYGIDKFASERYVINYYQLYGIPATVLRYFNVYGPRQHSGSPYSGVISIFMNRFKGDLPGLTVYGDGKQTRDFVYVEDVVEANRLVMDHPQAAGQILHVGTGVRTDLLEMIDIFHRLSGKTPEIEFKPERKGDIRHSVADISRIRNLGYTPRFDIRRGLELYFRHETRIGEGDSL